MDRHGSEYEMAKDILMKTSLMVGSIAGSATSPGLKLALGAHKDNIDDLVDTLDRLSRGDI